MLGKASAARSLDGAAAVATASAAAAAAVAPSGLAVRLHGESPAVPWLSLGTALGAAVGLFAVLRWMGGEREAREGVRWEERRDGWLQGLLDYRNLTFVEKEEQMEISGLSLCFLVEALHRPNAALLSRSAVRYSIAASVFAARTFHFLKTENFKEAIAQAETLDMQNASGKGLALKLPLAGVPVSVSLGDSAAAAAFASALEALGAIVFARGHLAVPRTVKCLANPHGPQLCCRGLAGSAGAALVAFGGSFLDVSKDVAGEALLSACISAVPVFLPTAERWQTPTVHGRLAFFARSVKDLKLADAHLCSLSRGAPEGIRGFALVAIGSVDDCVANALQEAGKDLQKTGAKHVQLTVSNLEALMRVWKRMQGTTLPASALLQLRAEEEFLQLRREILLEMAALAVDVLLCPASERLPLQLAEGLKAADRDSALLLAILGGPVGGLPVSCVPRSTSKANESHVVSVLVAAAPMQDALCLNAMVALEERSLVRLAMRNLKGSAADLDLTERSHCGFPPTDERRQFLFMKNQKYGNYGCMDREPELLPCPMRP